jgi:hypothetical protein
MAKKNEPAAAAPRKTIEALREEKRTPDWLFAAAKALAKWPIGLELTAEEYDRVVQETANLKIG